MGVFTWTRITFPKDVSERDLKRDWDRDLNYVRLHGLQTHKFPITIRNCALRVIFCSYYAVRAR